MKKQKIQIIGVEADESDALKRSMEANEIITIDITTVFADGAALRNVGEHNFKFCQRFLSGVITVSTKQICEAIEKYYTESRYILEPAGALAIAGALKYSNENNLKGKKMIVVTSGANMDFGKLEFIKEVTSSKCVISAKIKTRKQLVVFWDKIKELKIYRLSFFGNCLRESLPNTLLSVGPEDELLSELNAANIEAQDESGNEFITRHGDIIFGAVRASDLNEKKFIVLFPRSSDNLNTVMTKILDMQLEVTIINFRQYGEDITSLLVGLKGKGVEDFQIPGYEVQQLEL